jgi:hypothetical protein
VLQRGITLHAKAQHMTELRLAIVPVLLAPRYVNSGGIRTATHAQICCLIAIDEEIADEKVEVDAEGGEGGPAGGVRATSAIGDGA